MLASNKINGFENHTALRVELVTKMSQEVASCSNIGNMIETWWRFGSNADECLQSHLQKMEICGEWATDLEIMVFSLFLGLR